MSKLTRYNGTEVANLSLGQAGITYITGGTVNAVDTCTRFVSVLILVAGSGNLVLTNVDEDDGVAYRGIAGINFPTSRFSAFPTKFQWNKMTITCKTSSGTAKWGIHNSGSNAEFGTFSHQDFQDYVIFWRRDHNDTCYLCATGTTTGQTVTIKALKIEPCDGNPMTIRNITAVNISGDKFAPNRNSGKMINMTAADIEEATP